MILTSINDQPIYLLDDMQDGGKFSLTVKVPTQQEAGLTDRETRRSHGETLRCKVQYTAQASGVAARLLAASLRSLKNEPVAAPLWPLAIRWADHVVAPVAAGLWMLLASDESEVAALTLDAPPEWAEDDDLLVPLVVGYLETRELVWHGNDCASLNVSLIEDSPVEWALTGDAYEALAGPNPAGLATAPSVFPFPTTWSDPHELFTLRVTRDQFGFGRQTTPTVRPAVSVARSLDQQAFLNADEGWTAGQLLGWFADHGAGRAFWAAGQVSAAHLGDDVEADAVGIFVDDTTGIVVGDCLAFVSGLRVLGWVGPVGTVAGQTVGFGAHGNPAVPAASTLLAPLILGRLAKPELKIDWIGGNFLTATFAVREVPPEAGPAPVGETPGTTLGNLPTRAWLYTFTKDFAGTVVTETYTSFERDLDWGGSTFLARPITHGTRGEGIALDQDMLTITCAALTVPALLEAATLRGEVPCNLIIQRAEVVAGVIAAVDTIFTGDLGTCSIAGQKLTASAVTIGAMLDRKAPRFYLQVGCNYALFSPGCRLLAADWRHTATVSDPGVPGYPFTFTLTALGRDGGLPLIVANAFAGGWIEFGTGAALQRKAILASGAVGGDGLLVLTLGSDPATYPVAGDAVVLYPGCDGAAATCKARFDNYVNFGGHPFTPVGNPSLFKLSADAGGGGKKG